MKTCTHEEELISCIAVVRGVKDLIKRQTDRMATLE